MKKTVISFVTPKYRKYNETLMEVIQDNILIGKIFYISSTDVWCFEKRIYNKDMSNWRSMVYYASDRDDLIDDILNEVWK
jgi:hypothetical protein